MFFEPKISPVRRSIAAQLKKPSVLSETVVDLKTATSGVWVGVGVGVGEGEADRAGLDWAVGVVPVCPGGKASQTTRAAATSRTPATPIGQAIAAPVRRRGLPRWPGTRAGRGGATGGDGGTLARPTGLDELRRSSI